MDGRRQRIAQSISLHTVALAAISPHHITLNGRPTKLATALVDVSGQTIGESIIVADTIDILGAGLKSLSAIGACGRAIWEVDAHITFIDQAADFITGQGLYCRDWAEMKEVACLAPDTRPPVLNTVRAFSSEAFALAQASITVAENIARSTTGFVAVACGFTGVDIDGCHHVRPDDVHIR
jgi:hypothetical protein